MKALLFFCTLLSLPPAAFALVDQPPPRREKWEKLLESHFDVSDRATLINLATWLPKIYGFHFVCQFRSAAPTIAPIAVLPGEWLETVEGGILHCPDNYDLTIGKNTKVRVQQEGSIPRFYFERGQGSILFHQETFFIEMAPFDLVVAGKGKESSLNIISDASHQAVLCDQGAATLVLTQKDFRGNQLLASHVCRLEVGLGDSAIKRYMGAGDLVSPIDLPAPRRFWPPHSEGGPNNWDSAMSLGFEITGPQAAPNDPIKIGWNLAAAIGTTTSLDCVIYGQLRDSELAKEVTKFRTNQLAGQLTIDPIYSAGYLAMVCDLDKSSISSRILDLGVTLRARASQAAPAAAAAPGIKPVPPKPKKRK